MAVYGYVRVSTAEQANSGDSLDTQKRQISGYCMVKGWEVDRFFVEGGVSGSVPMADRPEGANLIVGAKAGDQIVVAKLDRMFRDAGDALETMKEFEKTGVDIHMIDIGGDVRNSPMSKFFFTVMAAFAEMERGRIRERIREVKRDLKLKGVYGGGTVPYGFDLGADGKLQANIVQQAIIIKVRDLRREGYSFRTIANLVNQDAPENINIMQVKRILDREQVAA